MSIKKPNILFIVLDTLRRDRLSLYGFPQQTSPELDAFAQHATVFERAVAPAQWTIPSHASMFTGQYPGMHGLTQADRVLPRSLPTMAETLQAAGYHTAAFCNNPLVGVVDHGLQRGFEGFYNYSGPTVNRPADVSRGRVRRVLSRRFARFARRVGNRFAHSDWLFRMSLNPLVVPLWQRLINYKGDTARSVSDLIDYIGQHRAGGADQPLFAFLNLMGAHLPYRPPQDALARVAPDLLNDRRAFAYMARFNREAARWPSPPEEPFPDWERRTLEGFYEAEIAVQDIELGRLLRYLQQSGALEDTAVVITADHGEGHGDHDFFGHGFVVYQELVHVPLIIYQRDHFPAGKRISTNVSTRRIFHTVLEMAGAAPALPEGDPNADVAGLSLARSLNCRPDPEGGRAFSEAFPPLTFLNVLRHRSPAMIERLHLTQVRRGLYEGDHKLAMVGEQVEGLFDVGQDPTEEQNMAGSKPELVHSLRGSLDHFVAATTPAGDPRSLHLSPAMIENMRALGYME